MCVAQAQTATIFMCRYLFKVLNRWHSSDKKQQSQCIYTYMYVCMYVCLYVGAKDDYSSRLWSLNSWIATFSRCTRFKRNVIPGTEQGTVYFLGSARRR